MGQSFRRHFGEKFEFLLEPRPAGWEIVIKTYGREENLARLTPPLHFQPNPREIEGWHLSATPTDCLSRPYAAESGPASRRQFIFSPQVGDTIDGPNAGRQVTHEEIETIGRFGHGRLSIDDFSLIPGNEAGCPDIKWLKFTVHIDGGWTGCGRGETK